MAVWVREAFLRLVVFVKVPLKDIAAVLCAITRRRKMSYLFEDLLRKPHHLMHPVPTCLGGYPLPLPLPLRPPIST